MHISGVKVKSIDPGRVLMLHVNDKTDDCHFQFTVIVNGNISYLDPDSYLTAAECKQKMRETVHVLRRQHGLTI